MVKKLAFATWPAKQGPTPSFQPPPKGRPRMPTWKPQFGPHSWRSQWRVPKAPLPTRSRLAPYFDALEIPSTSSFEDVKRAYRRLALKHHPDKNRGVDGQDDSDAAQLFRTVADAYERLSDHFHGLSAGN